MGSYHSEDPGTAPTLNMESKNNLFDLHCLEQYIVLQYFSQYSYIKHGVHLLDYWQLVKFVEGGYN